MSDDNTPVSEEVATEETKATSEKPKAKAAPKKSNAKGGTVRTDAKGPGVSGEAKFAVSRGKAVENKAATSSGSKRFDFVIEE